MKYFALLTKLGENLFAQATALGTNIELTQMAVGDGGGKLPTPDTNQTKLIAEKRRAAINTLFIDDNNKNQIIAEQIIPESEGGWWIREIGLFDKAGNLIAVANCPETYKPQLVEGSGRTQSIRMVLIVSHTESVTLKIDPSVVLATREYVDGAIIALDKKLQANIDKKINKSGDYVTGTLDFSRNVQKSYDQISISAYSEEEINYLRKFRGKAGSTIIHEIVSSAGYQFATGSEPTNIIYSLSSQGSVTVSGRIIPGDFLDFNQRYLGIGNAAVSAKKLDKPSRIAGHTFQGLGEDIKISPQDIGAQPAGEYVTSASMIDALSNKLDVGQYGFGGRGTVYNFTAAELESLVKSPNTPSQIFRHDGAATSLLYKYSTTLLMGAAGVYTLLSVDSKSGKVKVAAGSNNDDTVINELYGTVNTTTDKNGFLGTTSATTLITSNVTQSTGVSTANVMSQKATTDAINAVAEKALGEGQKWYDLTSQRTKMTAYTNTGKKPIFVVIGGVDPRGDAVYVTCDDVNVGYLSRTSQGVAVTVSFVVPSGSTYRLSDFDFRFWSELR